MKHDLKIWPAYFEAVLNDDKNFEYRFNDRNYRTNDTLLLREYDPEKKEYSGREIEVTVTYILYVDKYAIMAIRKNKAEPVRHGHWKVRYFSLPLSDGSDHGFQCSECLTHWDCASNYCPYCGAKMYEES